MLRTFLARTLSTAASSNPASKGTGFVTRKVASNEGLTTRTFPKTYFARLRYKAPFFNCPAVVDGSLKNVSLHDYKGKNLVLVFYPMDFTFVCPTEIIAFNDRVEEFRALDAEVAAISVDSANSHLAWTKSPRTEGGLGATRIPLLSDITKSVSKAYNVLDYKKGISLRGTFIIDKNSIIRQCSINDLEIGRSVDETLRLLQAMIHADEHGEVCPANWKKGEPSIKPNPEDAAKYFKTLKVEE